jgi:hypothetical protein
VYCDAKQSAQGGKLIFDGLALANLLDLWNADGMDKNPDALEKCGMGWWLDISLGCMAVATYVPMGFIRA